MKYIDLGLPSGTLWTDENEEDYYIFDEAVEKYGASLPTKEQFEELKNNCRWEWWCDGYKVTGPNGNSIVLPATGVPDCDGCASDVGSDGFYWSSTPAGSANAWSLLLNPWKVDIDDDDLCLHESVRLVKK